MQITEERIYKYGQVVEYLPARFRKIAMELSDSEKILAEEFRLRAGRSCTVRSGVREIELSADGDIKNEELQTVIEIATRSSVHTAQMQLAEGYFTVCGGHRIGICGTAVKKSDKVIGIRDLSSVSIRIAKNINDAAVGMVDDVIKDKKFYSTIIISPPGFGKTTALRDLVRRVSDKGYKISLVDERGEIAAKHKGIAQFDVGKCTDILDGVDKATGAMLMLRTMTPDIIAIDEITEERDINAISSVANCGVGIIATAHGESIEKMKLRPIYKKLFELNVFSTAIILSKKDSVFTHRIIEI